MNSEPRRGRYGASLFGALFEAGTVAVDDEAWLQAMLDTEAALARAAERAGLALPGSGAAVTSIATTSFMDNASLGVSAAAAGNPVPALVKAMTGLVPSGAAQAIHLGATSQDIIDTAAMLLARQAIDATQADLAAAAESCAALTREHAATLMSGRTLLQQAVPITFGLVTAGWLTALDEARGARGGAPPPRPASRSSTAAPPGPWPRWARRESRSRGCWARNWTSPFLCSPGTPTGCGYSRSRRP